MVFADSLTKATRLIELQYLFQERGQKGLTTAEIAARLAVAPRTVRNYIGELSVGGRLPVYREGRRWHLQPDARLELVPVRFLLEEAVAVVLAARLLMRHADEPNAAVANAVAKLGHVVPAPLREAVDEIRARCREPRGGLFEEIFRTLAYAWGLHREVEVFYAPRTGATPYGCRLRPYLLEPAAVGSAIYAIGHADPPGAVRVLKLERMAEARLCDGTFDPPPMADLLDRLERAWGVWIADSEDKEVTLHFDAAVAARVAETRWHPSQVLLPAAEGGIEMQLCVSSTVELLPWILGWGSHCEVLAPSALREAVAAELISATARYAAHTPA